MLRKLFTLSASLVGYHFVGFPAILSAIASRRNHPEFPQQTDDELPIVSLHILARNEEAVIASKIENSLALEYPRQKLQIIVVANGCTDRTADIVREYSSRGVVLAEFGEIGKTEAQRRAVRNVATGEILVFSDANVMYDPDALLELTRPFQDASVGSVCGNHVITDTHDPRSQSEGWMWNLTERGLKTLESRAGGAIGANGSIYAVRAALFHDLPPDVYEDFWQPMLIAVDGKRTVYAPAAIGREEVEAPDLKIEHRRKMRIVQQSVAGMIKFRWVLNPFRHPWLAWVTFSHKVLRWAVPFLLGIMLVTTILALPFHKASKLQRLFFFVSTIAGFLALLGRGLGRHSSVPVLTQAYYAVLMLHAAFQGTIDGFKRGSFASWDSAR